MATRIEVKALGYKPLTTYIPNDGPKPYYFPLIGPTGTSRSRDPFRWQKVAGEKYSTTRTIGPLWFTHGSVNKVDFWSEAAGHGTIKETSRPTVVSGAAVGLDSHDGRLARSPTVEKSLRGRARRPVLRDCGRPG